MGYALEGEEKYLQVAKMAADSYYARYVASGRCNGGPLDIYMAPDSESITGLLDAFVTLYEQSHDHKHLVYAQGAADLMSTWVMAYNGTFPEGSSLDRLGVQTTGGIIANVQNHHIGPSTATTSTDSLFRLYRYTGERVYLKLMEDIATCLQQYISQYDGHIGKLKRGMMTEQINLTDALNLPGEIWDVSASWGQTNVLLTHAELPSIYIDPAARVMGVFDHIKAHCDFEEGRVKITNTTHFKGVFKVMIEDTKMQTITLEPKQSSELKF